MASRAIPRYFFLNDNLHMFIRVVETRNDVVAWNYPEEKRTSYPRLLVRKHYKRAFTIVDAAKLMKIKPRVINELLAKGLVKSPARIYDLSDYRPGRRYFHEDDMLELRQAAYDQLPKDRFGDPHDDSMVSEDLLLHRIATGDPREFYYDEDEDSLEQIYKA